MTTALEASSIVATNDVVANVSFGRCCGRNMSRFGVVLTLGSAGVRYVPKTAARLGQTLSLLSGNVLVVEAIEI